MNTSVTEILRGPLRNTGRAQCARQLRQATEALRRICRTALAGTVALVMLCGSLDAQSDRSTRVWYAARDRVAVYKGPSEASPVVVSVPIGTKLVEIGNNRGWIEVAVPESANKTGFVHRLLVSRNPPVRR